MKVSELSTAELRGRLGAHGIYVHTGPFVFHLQSPITDVADGIRQLYADYYLVENTDFSDFHVRLAPSPGLRRWLRPQVLFQLDNRRPFDPFPLGHAFALLEWGLNWCVSTYANQYLKIHAAVLEKEGRALIMPGAPGAGKSTLCAALVARGWRLLSDELALISLTDAGIVPLPRPISLKNESIQVIREFAPEVTIGPISSDTHKGTVGHMKPPAASIARAEEPAYPAWIVFPRYLRDAPTQLTPLAKARGFMRIAENAFNYSLLGVNGFEALARLIDDCSCFEFSYGDLHEAVSVFDSLEAA